MLNRTGLSIDPWDTPLVTDLQLGIVSLTTTLRAQPFRQHLIHAGRKQLKPVAFSKILLLVV